MVTWLLLALVLAGLAAWALWPTKQAQPDVRQRAAERSRQEWARNTLRRMPAAWAAAGVTPTSSKPGAKVAAQQVPVMHSPGRWLEDGIEWEFSAHGHDVAELAKHAPVVESALNEGRGRVAYVEIRPAVGDPGRGVLRALWTHPLAKARPWPYQPGETPMANSRDKAVLGVDTGGQPVRLGVLEYSALFGGQNGSGKTIGVLTYLANLMPLPDVEITVYDASVKRGADYLAMLPRLRALITEPQEIAADLARQFATFAARAGTLGERAYQPTREMPVRVMLVEEAPALLEVLDSTTLRLIAQQTRAYGGVLVLVSQSGHSNVMDTVLRGELRNRVCYRVANWQAADMILGDVPDAKAYQLIPQQWPGTADVDRDGTGLTRFRTYLPGGRADSDAVRQWMGAHALATAHVAARLAEVSDQAATDPETPAPARARKPRARKSA